MFGELFADQTGSKTYTNVLEAYAKDCCALLKSLRQLLYGLFLVFSLQSILDLQACKSYRLSVATKFLLIHA